MSAINIRCKSYSWSTANKMCIWSVDAIHYDHNYVFLVKAQIATAGDPAAVWREFPGVKFIVAHAKEKDNVDFDKCKSICEVDVTCKSFSFKSSTNFCSWGSNGMSYDEKFNYFEKDKHSPSKILERKEEQLKKAEAKMQEDMAAAEKKDQAVTIAGTLKRKWQMQEAKCLRQTKITRKLPQR